MSGGHFERIGFLIQESLNMLAEHEDVRRRWKTLATLFEFLGPWLYALEKEMDWDLSGDKALPVVDEIWERSKLVTLLDAVLKGAPDDLFPRGKWATIQAIQERARETDTTPEQDTSQDASNFALNQPNMIISCPIPPDILTVFDSSSKPIITFHSDGRITVSDAANPTVTAQQVLEAMARAWPSWIRKPPSE